MFGDVFSIDFNSDAPIKSGIFDQMEDLGYNTSSALFACGTVALLTAVYAGRVLFYFGMVVPYNYITGKGLEYKRRLAARLFYAEILQLTIIAYFEMLICGYLNLSAGSPPPEGLSTARRLQEVEDVHDPSLEKWSMSIGTYAMIVCLIVMPLLFAYLFGIPVSQVNHDKYSSKKFQRLYNGIKTKERATLMFYPLYIARRLVFSFMAFYVFEFATI